MLPVGALLPSRSLGGGCLPLLALARLRPDRALRGRGGAVPAASAIGVPACTPCRRTVLPSRAVSARESSGRRRPASQVLLLPPRHRGAEPLIVHASCPCVRTANAGRTGHAFVTLPLLLTSARKREDAGASPGSLATQRLAVAVRNQRGPRPNEIAAMVGERIDLARKPLRLRGSLFDFRNLA